MEQIWWNKHVEEQYSTFKEWVGDELSSTKLYSANYCLENGYNSVADLGCGDATFYFSLQRVSTTISYIGVDSCNFFVKMNNDRNIPTLSSDIRNIPLMNDSSVDICFSRHTLEHQPTYDSLLREMIRIGKKEACHIFFIKPDNIPEQINFSDDLYHNKYCINDIESFLSSINKVKQFTWIDLGTECALHIILNN